MPIQPGKLCARIDDRPVRVWGKYFYAHENKLSHGVSDLPDFVSVWERTLECGIILLNL